MCQCLIFQCIQPLPCACILKRLILQVQCEHHLQKRDITENFSTGSPSGWRYSHMSSWNENVKWMTSPPNNVFWMKRQPLKKCNVKESLMLRMIAHNLKRVCSHCTNRVQTIPRVRLHRGGNGSVQEAWPSSNGVRQGEVLYPYLYYQQSLPSILGACSQWQGKSTVVGHSLYLPLITMDTVNKHWHHHKGHFSCYLVWCKLWYMGSELDKIIGNRWPVDDVGYHETKYFGLVQEWLVLQHMHWRQLLRSQYPNQIPNFNPGLNTTPKP